MFDARRLPDGTTLVEVMLAAAIFTIVMIGGHSLFTYGKVQIGLQKRYRAGVQLAAQTLEELKAEEYSNLSGGNNEDHFSLEGLPYSRSTSIEAIGLYKKVTVAVLWRHNNLERDVTLVTFIASK